MKNVILPVFVLTLMMVGSVNAFGVASPCWIGHDCSFEIGTQNKFIIELQNVLGNQDVTVSAEVIEGNKFVSLDKSEYMVPAGKILDIPVKVDFGSVDKGSRIPVKIDFKSVSSLSQSGTGISLSPGVQSEFFLVGVSSTLAGSAPGTAPFVIWFIIFTFLIALVIVVLVVLVKNKEDVEKISSLSASRVFEENN